MSASVQRLETTGNALREAMAQQDWAAIAALDLQCRKAVEEAMVDAQHEAALPARMQQLLDLYGELVQVCRDERRRVAGELLQLNQSAQGAKVYQMFG